MTDGKDARPTFERYDERVADGLVQAHEKGEGLPGYLGIRLTETWPGGMRAEVAVRDDLLNPFGNLHGGVLAALCDHVLGTVCSAPPSCASRSTTTAGRCASPRAQSW